MLHRNAWFIKEHVGMFKWTDTYDILDPADQTKLGVAKEQARDGRPGDADAGEQRTAAHPGRRPSG